MNSSERRTAEGALFTDLYQLTMAQLYFREGIHERPALFDYFYRKNPDYGSHQAGYCVFAGVDDLLDYLEETRFTRSDTERLSTLRSGTGAPLFGKDFLEWLEESGGYGGLEVRAVAEGRVVHPGAPLATVQGPLAAAQLLETALLNHLNYPTLVATKASRLREAAGDGPVLEFGMRRGQGLGVNTGSRAALIGGVDASSNTGTSALLGVPPKGTHAHSMVQAFIACGGEELDAFRAYARSYPDDCLLLIDTVDTLGSGLPNAITVFEELRRRGHEPRGVRLDSGDLAHLAVACAAQLNRAGFPDTTITLSNQLDELTIWQIRSQVLSEAALHGLDGEAILERLSYGVGTRLIVSEGAPALDGVYKLVALQAKGEWQPAIKISDTPAKTITPGHKDLYRVYDERGKATADLVTLHGEELRSNRPLPLYHPAEPEVRRTIQPDRMGESEPLLAPAWQDGRRIIDRLSVHALRSRRQSDQERLDVGVRRLLNPHVYHVSLSESLSALKQELLRAPRTGRSHPEP